MFTHTITIGCSVYIYIYIYIGPIVAGWFHWLSAYSAMSLAFVILSIDVSHVLDRLAMLVRKPINLLYRNA